MTGDSPEPDPAPVPAEKPSVHPDDWPFVSVRGTFYRAVDPAYEQAALNGSRSAGRYSPPDVPTLYLSSSREGVAAAMQKHSDSRTPALRVLAFEVHADRIADLRDSSAMAELGVVPDDAFGDWLLALANGATPPSWRVRERLESMGASGLIDPSRKSPALWHLTLFAWNTAAAPSVHSTVTHVIPDRDR